MQFSAAGEMNASPLQMDLKATRSQSVIDEGKTWYLNNMAENRECEFIAPFANKVLHQRKRRKPIGRHILVLILAA